MSDWQRQGECNGCGDCCRQATNPVPFYQPLHDEAYGRVRFGEPVYRVDLIEEREIKKGVPVFKIEGPLIQPCPKLVGDLCSIHETKPQYCKDTPINPEDIAQLYRCSYTFLNVKTGEVRGPSGVIQPTKESGADEMENGDPMR